MARRSTGGVVVKRRKGRVTYALRFRTLGQRQYVTLGSSVDGWTRKRAEEELQNVLADVRRGIWRPPAPEPAPEKPRPEPTFHEFASEWLEGKAAEGLAERTLEDYRWSLSGHLLPVFARMRLGEITVEEVDRYRRAKVREREAGDQLVAALAYNVRERPTAENRRRLYEARRELGLSAVSINKTLKHLGAVLDLAVEYGHLPSNPAKGRRRRLRAGTPRRASMRAEQVAALLRAAGQHRPLLATAIMAGGLRASECTGLRWQDVDLAGGWLSVAASKTEAGRRRVDLAPHLLHELKAPKAGSRFASPADYVFPTARGTRRDRNSVRTRILYPAIEQANALLAQEGRPPIPEGVTFHSLRRTYATLMAEAGADSRYVMGQIGHRSAALTLEVYTDVGDRKHDGNARLGALLLGSDWAPTGTNEAIGAPTRASGADRDTAETRF
jgi:integrase